METSFMFCLYIVGQFTSSMMMVCALANCNGLQWHIHNPFYQLCLLSIIQTMEDTILYKKKEAH